MLLCRRNVLFIWSRWHTDGTCHIYIYDTHDIKAVIVKSVSRLDGFIKFINLQISSLNNQIMHVVNSCSFYCKYPRFIYSLLIIKFKRWHILGFDLNLIHTEDRKSSISDISSFRILSVICVSASTCKRIHVNTGKRQQVRSAAPPAAPCPSQSAQSQDHGAFPMM